MTALDQLPTALRAWGLDVVEVTGWQTRRRPGPFTPLGVLIHHTAGPRGKDAPSLQVCIDGRRDLAGPLCQILIARSGKVYVISVGRCNHAGIGGPLAGVVGPDQGNTNLVGIELENDGVSEPWPAIQIDSAVLTSAAVLDLIRRPRSHCWAHREYTSRKPDPRNIDMLRYRHSVGIARPATPVPSGGPTMPTPPKPPTSLVEQWQRMLLDNGADLGPSGADGQMGRLTLAASQTILDHRNQLLAEAKAHAETITRYGKERDDARQANRTSSDTITRLLKELDAARKANGTAALAKLIATVDIISDQIDGAVAEARRGLA